MSTQGRSIRIGSEGKSRLVCYVLLVLLRAVGLDNPKSAPSCSCCVCAVCAASAGCPLPVSPHNISLCFIPDSRTEPRYQNFLTGTCHVGGFGGLGWLEVGIRWVLGLAVCQGHLL